MRTIYATTKPGRGDTRFIALGKWLQQLREPSVARAGTVVEYSNTKPRASDTRLIALQKILQLEQSIKGLQSDLVSHWKLDDANYLDSAGTNHLTANGLPSMAEGKINAQSVRFNPAMTDFLYHASNTGLQASGQWSFAGWFYLTGYGPTTSSIISKWGTDAYEYRLYLDAIGRLQVWTGQGTFPFMGTASAVLALNTWHFFTWTCAYSTGIFRTLTLTIDNGTPITNELPIPLPAAMDFRIGAHRNAITGDWRYFTGRIENVSFWDRVITATEKSLLWNNGAGRPFPFSL